MVVGCPDGCGIWLDTLSKLRCYGLDIALDLSCAALSHVIGKCEAEGTTARYLYVNPKFVEMAKEILYGYSVARGLKACALTLCSDNDMLEYGGWLVSDERRPDTAIVEWDYVFPQHVRVVNGSVESDEEPNGAG